MKIVNAIICLFIAFGSVWAKETGFSMKLNRDNSVTIVSPDGAKVIYRPEFVLISSESDPHKELRRGNFGLKSKTYITYNVPTWGTEDNFVVDPSLHIADGFDPKIDRSYGSERTANYFRAGNVTAISAVSAEQKGNGVTWNFSENGDFQLVAKIFYGDDDVMPKLSIEFIPYRDGWYSIGYAGAPEYDLVGVEELMQSHIWTERRFPNEPFLSEAFRLSIPGTLVTSRKTTAGIIADPKYVPFEIETPTSENSQFGAMIRNGRGNVQSMLFAPVLGNADSEMKKGDRFIFDMLLYQKKCSLTSAYEDIAYRICGFRDMRSNSTCNLNTTIKNVIEYMQSPYSMFVDSLKGFAYSTDVPGSVKNISGLHPLETAILTDDESLYSTRALPMLEFGLSREKFIFTTNRKVKGQGATSNMTGPHVSVNELAASYNFFGGKSDFFIDEAERIYTENLGKNYKSRWITSLALYKATGNKDYLYRAIDECDRYLDSRVLLRQESFYDKYSIGMFFWTSFSNQWMELLQMYYETGFRRYLDAAEDGAMHFAQFCWMIPSVPDTTITVNPGNKVPLYRNRPDKYRPLEYPEAQIDAWKVSEIGLTPEATGTSSGGHRAIFMANHAPFMMRIAAETGNRFLHDIARNAIVGRYENFPGYHINRGRTNIFESKDFAYHKQNEINAHSSIHYNHIPSFLTMLWDYLFADFYCLSDKQISFPFEYSDGYAYCRNLIFGNEPGRFYDEENVYAYMPSDIVTVSDIQANYLTAYGNGKLYLALANQSDEDRTVTVCFNEKESFVDPSASYECRLWKQNIPSGTAKVENGRISLELPAGGITAIAIDGVDVQTDFQHKAYERDRKKWSVNYASAGMSGDKAVLFDYAPDLRSVYVWTQADEREISEMKLHYTTDDGKEKTVVKNTFPFEFTVQLPENASSFTYWLECVRKDGTAAVSEKAMLHE